jgi:hypothetical protein
VKEVVTNGKEEENLYFKLSLTSSETLYKWSSQRTNYPQEVRNEILEMKNSKDKLNKKLDSPEKKRKITERKQGRLNVRIEEFYKGRREK